MLFQPVICEVRSRSVSRAAKPYRFGRISGIRLPEALEPVLKSAVEVQRLASACPCGAPGDAFAVLPHDANDGDVNVRTNSGRSPQDHQRAHDQ